MDKEMKQNRSHIQPHDRFGSWMVISFSHRTDTYKIYFNCRCDCGISEKVEQARLNRGDATKCRDCANANRKKHKPVEVGGKYGKWAVVKILNKNYCFCRCSCGNEKEILSSSLIRGDSLQCKSCARREGAIKHGHTIKGKVTPEYQAWCNMKNRILNPNVKEYINYGGRGIKICERWLIFDNFLADVDLRPSSQYSLDRIDNEGDYEPRNVHWTKKVEQVRNRRKSFKVNGVYIDLKKLSSEISLKEKTIKSLFGCNYTLDDIKELKGLSHYQKSMLGKSIKSGSPLPSKELKQIFPSNTSKKHPLYYTYSSIKQRCCNANCKDYKNYGAKGIVLCEEWSTFEKFLNGIIVAIGEKPSPKYCLDRISNEGNYEPNNVRWATNTEQSRNKTTSTYIDGKGVSAKEVAQKFGLSADLIIELSRLNWDEEGFKFYRQLSYKEKRLLKIRKQKLTQHQAIEDYLRINSIAQLKE